MSAASPVDITPPTEAFVAIAQKYASDIREAVEKQTNPFAMLKLPNVSKEIEKQFLENYHEKTMRNYSANSQLAYNSAIFLINGGSGTQIHAGLINPAIPLLIIGSVTARVRIPGRPIVPVPLQEGSVVCVAGAEEVYLEMLGDGKVVWGFLFYSVKA
ncbi:MAG: hypothetical protein M1840_006331 [Geoglossum simile]|nr:MAG: hypothetical protein M1840_006331 [Geoglossum simile]